MCFPQALTYPWQKNIFQKLLLYNHKSTKNSASTKCIITPKYLRHKAINASKIYQYIGDSASALKARTINCCKAASYILITFHDPTCYWQLQFYSRFLEGTQAPFLTGLPWVLATSLISSGEMRVHLKATCRNHRSFWYSQLHHPQYKFSFHNKQCAAKRFPVSKWNSRWKKL